MSVRDAELVRKAAGGDRAAFAGLVERYQGLVFGTALVVTRDAALAEDAAQEAFAHGWQKLSTLRDPDRIGPWLAGIARNVARSLRRRGSSRADADAAQTTRTPLDDLLDSESQGLLRRCLDDIPAAYREALVLFYFEGGSIESVADKLGVSEDVIKQRLSRGRRALRENVAERLESVLDRARPGKAFTAAVLAAIALPARGEAAAATVGKVVMAMSLKQGIVALVAVGVIGGVAWFGLHANGQPAGSARAGSDADPERESSEHHLDRRRSAVRVRRMSSSTERAALLAQIRDARERRVPGGRPAAPAPVPPRRAASRAPLRAAVEGDLDKEYIRDAVQDLIPMLIECATAAGDDTAIVGDIAIEFTIEGEPEVGGLIGTSEVIDDQTTIADPAFRECVRETMFAIEIDPPSAGGMVTVRYPFRFDQEP